MTDPDELYTLRAQYWLGHYNLAIEESRSLSRRPMNAVLKAERDEFLARAHIALGQFDKVMSDETEGTSRDGYVLFLLQSFSSDIFFLQLCRPSS